ncbi:MAG: hypothetical protein QOG83_2914 [Alphaproteobacteria bacterium]|jgi:hypothetical protein|nr:hypothetical protein [Alphaproteobacteria bacterium]MEA2937876.1 hypothetical protein [Alphaproteobacteria bacterium]MEA2990203.1 hypothetical protein [Alphaproteobacteria bacterium]
MRVFLLSCIAAAVLASATALVLNHYQKPVDVAYRPVSVRL